ncbi:MAG TPA: hypothetical protein VGZ02_06345 [Candidatus Baltobacteraceae bacterium]|jgi:Tfp pilus assembly protein PilO|nr:hypothetical protein [Candidatus Baltobacteraceae bacterium]
MTLGRFIRAGDDARAVWLAAILVFALGLYFVESSYHERIRDLDMQTEVLNRRVAIDTQTLAERPALMRVQRLAQRDLETVARDLPLSMTTAQWLPNVERLAAHCGVAVEEVSVQPIMASPVRDLPQSTAQAPAASWLLQTDVTIRVRGTFRAVLAFVQGLSHDRILIRVTNTEIESARGGMQGAHPALDATVHASLFRLQLAAMEQHIAAANR